MEIHHRCKNDNYLPGWSYVRTDFIRNHYRHCICYKQKGAVFAFSFYLYVHLARARTLRTRIFMIQTENYSNNDDFLKR